MLSDNSIFDLTRKMLADLFLLFKDTKGYWYKLLNNDSFSTYLAVSLAVKDSDFKFVMKCAGFLYKYGDNFRFNAFLMKKWINMTNLPVQITTFR